jgi:hypothetical protein
LMRKFEQMVSYGQWNSTLAALPYGKVSSVQSIVRRLSRKEPYYKRI